MDDCVEWEHARDRNNYGRVTDKSGRVVFTHRRAWEIVNGPIAGGLCVLHRCDNPPCFNTNHLFLGTQAENMADMKAKGRARAKADASGEENGHNKLSSSEVAELRAATQFGVRNSVLARLYGITKTQVGYIVSGKNWVSA